MSPWSHALRYGDRTAKGTAGGFAGVKVEAATRLLQKAAAMATALMNLIAADKCVRVMKRMVSGRRRRWSKRKLNHGEKKTKVRLAVSYCSSSSNTDTISSFLCPQLRMGPMS